MKPNAHITTSPFQTTPSPVALFVEGHKSGLWHAARLLGGYKAAGRVDDIAECLVIETNPSRRTLALLRDLHCPSSYKVGRQSDLSTGGSGSFV